MSSLPSSADVVRFGEYEANLRSRELRRDGLSVRLPNQSFEVLAMLLESAGELVSREDIRKGLWTSETFVDFDHGLNNAVTRLREALQDSAEAPRFIETLPRRGYRFIGKIEPAEGNVIAFVSSGVLGQIRERFAEDRQSLPIQLPLRPAASKEFRLEEAKRRNPQIRRFLITGALVGIIVLLLTFYGLWTRHSEVHGELKITPFTTYPGIEASPSFSPDGNQIVFWWDGGEGAPAPGLYIKQTGNERAVRLTDDAACVKPAWSPDGRTVAFSRWGDESGIYVVPSLGGPVRKLTTIKVGCDRYSHLSWSADGKLLAFPDADAKFDAPPNGAHLYLLDVETLERRMVPHPWPDCIVSWMPAFSPDGKSLAFACFQTFEKGALFTEHVSGGRARELVRFDGQIQGLAWSSDSNSLIYSLNRNLWRVPAIGGVPEQLPIAQAIAPAAARSQDRFAYMQYDTKFSIWRLDLGSGAKAAHSTTKLIASTRRESGPRISPDGRHIAFESERSGSAEIWLCESDGSNPVQMTFFGGPLTGTVRWSPDSRHIVFDSRVDGHAQLYVLDTEGGRPQKLSTGTEDAGNPFWSNDSHWIYFATEKNPGVWKVPASGGNAVRLTDHDGYYPQESANGDRVYYVRGTDPVTLWWVPVTGGISHRVDGMAALAGGDHWVPSKNGIYFLQGYDSPVSLKLFHPGDRSVTQIASLSGTVGTWGPGLTISGDGETILYGQVDGCTGDIMLVEGFH